MVAVGEMGEGFEKCHRIEMWIAIETFAYKYIIEFEIEYGGDQGNDGYRICDREIPTYCSKRN